jgi:hypothetical protein
MMTIGRKKATYLEFHMEQAKDRKDELISIFAGCRNKSQRGDVMFIARNCTDKENTARVTLKGH